MIDKGFVILKMIESILVVVFIIVNGNCEVEICVYFFVVICFLIFLIILIGLESVVNIIFIFEVFCFFRLILFFISVWVVVMVIILEKLFIFLNCVGLIVLGGLVFLKCNVLKLLKLLVIFL